jgi:ABC-type methionine transport system ATPase subunit
VAIASALALKPRVLLFDEPMSARDPELVNEVLDVIRQLARSGTTLNVVTHEIGFAREVADMIVLMCAGRVVESRSACESARRSSASAPANSFRRCCDDARRATRHNLWQLITQDRSFIGRNNNSMRRTSGWSPAHRQSHNRGLLCVLSE